MAHLSSLRESLDVKKRKKKFGANRHVYCVTQTCDAALCKLFNFLMSNGLSCFEYVYACCDKVTITQVTKDCIVWKLHF